MNKIEKLIDEFCPNGVEFKKLWEIVNFDKKFKGVPKEKQNEILSFKHVSANELKRYEKCNFGNVKLLSTGLYDGYIKYNENDNNINYGEIIALPSGGSPIIKYYNGYFIDSLNIIFSQKTKKECNLKFIYYFLIANKMLIEENYRGASVKHPNMIEIIELLIPIPPISIQNKIVEILDKYTELETELELRNKQYIYYRNELLDFNKNQVLLKKIIGSDDIESIDSKIEFKKIGDIGNFYSGLSGKNKNDFFKNANARYITYLNVFNNLEINVDKLENVRISKYEKQNKVEYGDILITISSETPDECGYVSIANHFIFKEEDIYLNSFCFGFRLHNLKIYNIKYFKYLFKDKNTRKKIIKCVNGVTRFNLSKEEFKNISIPIPPISIQNKIVEILDKLEAYTKYINVGLPFEIKQRKKQYEYYRNKLLDFKKY